MDVEETLWPDAPAELTAEREGISALIIDDEPHVRKFLRLALRALGVTQITEAANGAEGVALFEQLQPTIVLLDISMPVMPGDVAMRQIFAIDPTAAVVVVTSQSEHNTVKYFRDRGAMGFILKHSPAAEVRAMLHEALSCFVVEDGT